LEHLPPGLISN
jgi:hypothetical protein